jgi:hypothetical protein
VVGGSRRHRDGGRRTAFGLVALVLLAGACGVAADLDAIDPKP